MKKLILAVAAAALLLACTSDKPVSVKLNKYKLALDKGETVTLTATVEPANSGAALEWASSDISVATVDDGRVTGVAAGTAGITVQAGDKQAVCKITVRDPLAVASVDLGLPSGLKWAACNVGASSPEEYGDYYGWGETELNSSYDWDDYALCNGSSSSMTKYNTNSSCGVVDNKTVLDADDDVARVKLGGKWRIPTIDEWTELQTVCTWTWTTVNGVNGELVTGPGGKSIFLPAAGTRFRTDLYRDNFEGNYWSSNLFTDSPTFSYYLYFNPGGYYRSNATRRDGFSVRAVTDQAGV